MITQKELKRKLHYDPLTGVFTWLVRPAKWLDAGANAGSIQKNGYVSISIDNKKYYAHRLAWLYMTGSWPKGKIDHKDTDKSNCAWSNLREATPTQNNCNTNLRSDNTSGHKGVSWRKDKQRWCAEVKLNGKRVHCSYHHNINDAISAADNARDVFHKDFACNG